MSKPIFAALAASFLLAGCANTLLSDDRIRSSTAAAVGQPASSITIADRNYDGMTNTSYRAVTPRGSYQCVINGGTLLSAGMLNPAQCTPSR